MQRDLEKSVRVRYQHLLAMLIVLISGLTSLQAGAELRVLIQYDEQVHSLVRVVELAENKVMSPRLESRARGNPLTQVELKWFDANGELLHSSSIADPRLVHTPITGTGQAPQVLGLSTGAYMVSGPLGSTELVVRLPANPTLGLYSNTYRLDLLY